MAWMWLGVHDADAADSYKKWRCRGDDARVLRVPRSCEGEFRTYAKDLQVGFGVDMGQGSANATAHSTTVELALDAINKDLRTNYVALCMGWTSPDPCDEDAIQRYNDGREKLAEGASALRRALASADGDPERIERALDALADGKQRDLDLLDRLDRLVHQLEEGPSPVVPGATETASIAGRWLATFTHRSRSACLGTTFSREIQMFTAGDRLQATIVASDGAHIVLTGGYEGTEWLLSASGDGVYRSAIIGITDAGMEGMVEVRVPGLLDSCSGTYVLQAVKAG